MRPDPQPPREWVRRMFGSVQAWKRTRTRARHAFVCRPRKPVIHIRLVRERMPPWRLPCPDKPIPAEVHAAVADAVTGVGARPRLAYRVDDDLRVAVGRRGEPVDSLAGELCRLYPGTAPFPLDDSLRPLAEYAAGWIPRATDAAKRMRMRKSGFLSLAENTGLVQLAVLFDDDLHGKLWREEWTQPDDGLPGKKKEDRTVTGGQMGYGPGMWQWKDETWSERAMPLDANTEAHKHAGYGIGKMVPTGEYTTRDKPILLPVGRELSFRGAELRLYPHDPLRWTERQLIGFPVTPDWGTRQRRSSGVKSRLKKDHRAGPVREWHGADAVAYCMAHPSQPRIARVNSWLE